MAVSVLLYVAQLEQAPSYVVKDELRALLQLLAWPRHTTSTRELHRLNCFTCLWRQRRSSSWPSQRGHAPL